VDFLQNYIFQKYKNYLLVLDNARAHNNNLVKESIIDSSNKYLFTVPYTPKTNAIEMWFNQIKHTLKLNTKVLKFNELKEQVEKSIKKVKKINYENYFEYAYNKKNKTIRIRNTRRIKNYKLFYFFNTKIQIPLCQSEFLPEGFPWELLSVVLITL
tara:strand:+ start:830 stop:1297 length:468 start_codon:yes stop_codon:yes gene_type:complete